MDRQDFDRAVRYVLGKVARREWSQWQGERALKEIIDKVDYREHLITSVR